MNQGVLITGASGGIGKHLAERFAEDGYDVVLVARSADKLHDVAKQLEDQYGIHTMVMVKDLTDPNAPLELFEALRNDGIHIDVLVNNAGFGGYGAFSETDLQQELDMITVNVRALTHLTKLFLPEMIKHGKGRILNLASTASFQPGPMMAVYYATKAYVLSLSEALSNELKGTGIQVTALCPGPTDTGFAVAANMSRNKLFQSATMHVDQVVTEGYAGFKKGKRVVIPGARNKVLAFCVRFLPRRWVTAIVRHLQENG